MRAVLQRALGASLSVPADQAPDFSGNVDEAPRAVHETAPAPAPGQVPATAPAADPTTAPQVQVAHFTEEGLVALVAVHRDDTEANAHAMARKIAQLRILTGETSAEDRAAPVLLVSQFTLYGRTKKGRRPSWTDAAPGPQAKPLIDLVEQDLRALGIPVQTGIFGADMQVSLTNLGPFTVMVET